MVPGAGRGGNGRYLSEVQSFTHTRWKSPRGLLFSMKTTVTVLNCMVKTLLRGWSYVKCSSHKIILILILVPTE